MVGLGMIKNYVCKFSGISDLPELTEKDITELFLGCLNNGLFFSIDEIGVVGRTVIGMHHDIKSPDVIIKHSNPFHIRGKINYTVVCFHFYHSLNNTCKDCSAGPYLFEHLYVYHRSGG